MKKFFMFGIFTTLAIVVPPIVQTASAAQDQCSAEAKDALYASFLQNRQNDQKKAYDEAKKYLACPVNEPTEAQQKIIDYLKKYSAAYEKASSKSRLNDLISLLYVQKKYPEAYALGAEILATEPDNLAVLVHLGANGYLLVSNPSLSGKAVDYARKALQQLDAGKTLDDWNPIGNRDTAIAYLNYTIGTLTLNTDPKGALNYLMKSAQFETPLKKSPFTYAFIAGAYETGDYAKQSEEYKRLYGGKDETPESKLALANIYQLVDRMIDAYARAIALAGSDAAFAKQKPQWSESLMQWYKFRNNGSDAGLNELLATIVSKPLPPLPTPLTSPPQ